MNTFAAKRFLNMASSRTISVENMPYRANEKSGVLRKKIWIDLDNSPHIPFFAPIVPKLEALGYSVVMTGRDAYQVSELVQLFNLDCKIIGRHYGKNKLLKVWGVMLRALRLIPFIVQEKPDLAIAHGSRTQLLTSFLLGITVLQIGDYEHSSRGFLRLAADWEIVPEVIPADAIHLDPKRVLRYQGIKEDVYAPGFKPDPAIKAQLGLLESDLVVTIRPPASEAHYHNPQSDELFHAVIEHLALQPDAKMIVLPRNGRQANQIRDLWPELISNGRVLIPERVVDGLNIIWYSDLVISGGGTMNREAAALGVPVYSIFRGKIGAVDRYLAGQGRMILIENVAEIRTKINLARRNGAVRHGNDNHSALQTIVSLIVSVLNQEQQVPGPNIG
jgi:predicted glycosyltransferase